MAAPLKTPESDPAEMSEINVTPFIDVILVLLIIFMVAAPLSTVDVPVDLPAAHAEPQHRPDKPLFLTIKPDLGLAIGNEEVPREAFQAMLDHHTHQERGQRVFLRADGAVPYREIMAVMNLLRQAGYLKVALVGIEETPQR